MLNKKMITKTFVATILSLTMIAPASVFAYENTDSQYSEDVVVSEDVNIEQSENVNFHQVEIRDTNDLAILSDELDRFVQENPNSSEEEQDQHLIEFIKNGGLERPTTRSIGDYLPGYGKLNTAERKLAIAHPVQAVKVYNASKTATAKTIEVYGHNGWQDNSDAFRHCLWNALMKQSIGTSAAEKWATSHEYTSSGIDKQMDLHNNAVGRGINVSGKSTSSIVDAVKSKVRNGSCKRIINDRLVATDGSGM
ncbi:DUF6973 domain-containing protein [Streptobacillus moniliformis]|uniref:DUF6973 domain-containing protein n=1 Tax=Streptobacillus moniliformis TaxID=34105 RepID=UPI0009BE1B85|nr:hypothetical protein [Streptobacillus moniliformis]